MHTQASAGRTAGIPFDQHRVDRIMEEHGLDVLGQRLLFFGGTVLLLALGLLPAAVAAAIAFFVVAWLVGPFVAAALAWLVVLTILGVEIWAGVRWLGERFRRFDLSAELRP